MEQNRFKIWMAQIRANFLVLAAFLVAIGLAYSVKYPLEEGASFNAFHAILLLVGVVASHIAVNLFNELSDFTTKIDFNTRRTPFSGGSGMLTSGRTTYKSVRRLAIITLLFALAIGIYFSFVSHWIVIVFSFAGAFSILFYTNFLARILLGELFAGMALGTFVVLGTYVSMTATPGMSPVILFPKEVIWVSIPPGLLTALLLYLNQFPDSEADKKGGRRHLVIALGKKTASFVYAFGMLATFGIIVALPIMGISSSWLYLALLPLPFAVKATITTLRFGEDDISKLIPALGSNVLTVLLTDLMLAVAIFIDMIRL